jgi:hypothetical protein
MKWRGLKWFEYQAVAVFLLIAPPGFAEELKTQNVILLTLDGVRIEEIFAGLDETIAAYDEQKIYSEIATARERYGTGNAEQKRAALMPNLWQQLIPQGVMLGNPAYNNHVKVQNQAGWSRPGYTEIMTGGPRVEVEEYDDQRFAHKTVLEVAQEQLQLEYGQVIQIGSSGTYARSAASTDDALLMIGSKDTIPMPFGSAAMDELAELRRQVMGLWEEGTNDVLTFRMAQAYLQKNQPRVMWLALLNTDDWAHEDRYDRYVEYLHLADDLIGELWATVQSNDAYRDKTTLIITTDHGRGREGSNWSEHDTPTIPGTNDIWMAVIGPDTPDVGEARSPGTTYQGQAATTMLHYLGIDYRLLGADALPPVDITDSALKPE